MMKKIFSLIIILSIFACTNEILKPEEENISLKTEITEAISDNSNPLPEIQPPGLSPDQSWIVALNIKEGVFLGYTITYQSGEEITQEIDNSWAIIEKVDFISTKWLDNETYYIPHISGSKKGHWDLYIYKDGTNKYTEIITTDLNSN